MDKPASSARLPLHITISALFITLVVLLGIVLSVQSFNKASEIILSGASEIYTQVGQEVQLDFKATYRPVAQALEMLALSPLVHAGSLAERIDSLPLIQAALQNGTAFF